MIAFYTKRTFIKIRDVTLRPDLVVTLYRYIWGTIIRSKWSNDAGLQRTY